MKIGQLIKLERQRQNMKQEVLASGICVPSYLSKIENDNVLPSEDIKQSLLRRLNITMDLVNLDARKEKLIQFNQEFRDILNNRDRQKAKTFIIDLQQYINDHPLNPERLTLLIMETRLMLMVPEYVAGTKSNLALIDEFKKELTTEQLFYYYCIQGISAYQNNQFRLASQIFTQVFTLIKSYRMEEWEMAELYYLAGLSLLSESRYILAIDYVKEALAFYNQEILIERSIECIIILGIAQKNTGILNDALSTFEKAKEINSKIESTKFDGKIEHNLGSCHSLMKHQVKALQYFQESLKLKKDPNDKIITVFSIMKEYHKISDFNNAKIWLNKGLDLLPLLTEENKRFYQSHFSIYKAILLEEKGLISVFKEALNYFESKQDYINCYIYCHVLAKKLAEDKQYKQSTIYYEQGFKYHIQQSKVSNWEELS